MNTLAVNDLSFNGVYRDVNGNFSKRQRKVMDVLEHRLKNTSYDDYCYNSIQALDYGHWDVIFENAQNGSVSMSLIKNKKELPDGRLKYKEKYFIGKFDVHNTQSLNEILADKMTLRQKENAQIQWFIPFGIAVLSSLFLANKCSSINAYGTIVKEISNTKKAVTDSAKKMINWFELIKK